MASRVLIGACTQAYFMLVLGCGAFEFAAPDLAARGGNASSGGNGNVPVTPSGGTGVGGEGCSGNQPFPSTPVLDDFERDMLGEKWTAPKPSSLAAYELANGQLSTIAGLEEAIFWKAAQGSTQEVYATLVDYDPHLYGTWLFLKSETRGVDGFAIAVQYGADFKGSRHFALAINDGGWRDVAFTSADVGRGQVFGARSFGNGCVEAFIDGKLVLSADLSSQVPSEKYQRAASYIGLANALGNDTATAPSVWDDFGGGRP